MTTLELWQHPITVEDLLRGHLMHMNHLLPGNKGPLSGADEGRVSDSASNNVSRSLSAWGWLWRCQEPPTLPSSPTASAGASSHPLL